MSVHLYIYIILSSSSLSLSPVPLPDVMISPGSVNVSYNSTVNLTCVVQSLTTPTVDWTTDTNVTLTSLVSTNYTNIYTRILTLEQVTLEYIGKYTCTAENEEGEISNTINFTVHGKEIIMCNYLSVCLIVI